MQLGDVVELLVDQPLAPPLGTVPKGAIGEVISAPPALWVFKFPGYLAGSFPLKHLRVAGGPGRGSTGCVGSREYISNRGSAGAGFYLGLFGWVSVPP
jgi:hypothetical protein